MSTGIIIVNYRTPWHLDKCLHSVFKHTDDFHIYLVHNAPDPDSLRVGEKYAAKYPDLITVHVNRENLGLVAGINTPYDQAIKHQRICILNSDCIVAPGWLSQLNQEMDQNPVIAQISPDANSFYRQGLLGRLFRMLPGELSRLQILEYWLGLAPKAKQPQSFRPAGNFFDFCPGFCHLSDTKHYRQQGYFADPNIIHGYWDDMDFSCHLRQFGHVGSTQKSYVYHFLGSSFKLLHKQVEPEKQLLKRINGIYVMHKWRDYFASQLENWTTEALVGSLDNSYLRTIVEYFGVASLKPVSDYLETVPAKEPWQKINNTQ